MNRSDRRKEPDLWTSLLRVGYFGAMPRPKILLVVDDWELLERYEESFSADADVLCAPLGPEGIRLARSTPPDLILLNLTFENMTTEEACLALRAKPETRSIPVVAVGTGGPGPDHWVREPLVSREVLALISHRLQMIRDLAFRPLSRSDFPLLLRWLSEPHVVAWWHEPLDLAGLHAKYGPRVEGTEPTHVCVIEYRGQPAGWVQWYRWSDYPEHALQLEAEPTSAGIDLAIGEPDLIGAGLGPVVISEFLKRVVFADPRISAIVTDPEEGNLRSLRAFNKVGFTVTKTVQLRGESFRRHVVRLDRSLP